MSHTPYHWSNKRVLNYLMHVVTKQWIHQWLTFALEIANWYVHVLLYHLLFLLLILSFLSKLILLEWIGNGKIIKYSYFCYFFMKWPATKACFRKKFKRDPYRRRVRNWSIVECGFWILSLFLLHARTSMNWYTFSE